MFTELRKLPKEATQFVASYDEEGNNLAELKYSRQREAVYNFLTTRKDHPTADFVYTNIREEYPNVSLGTVYRNLQLLTSIGRIQKIRVGDGIDHFDADISPHNHFYCRKCGSVIDLDMDNIDSINEIAGKNFDGRIEDHIICFTGVCGKCLRAKNKKSKTPADT